MRSVVIAFLLLCSTSAFCQTTLKLVTEEYPPFNMSTTPSENGPSQIAGTSTDIIHTLMERSGYAYDIELMSWKRAYELARDTPDYGVYSTSLLESRMPLFKWVYPLVENRYVFFARSDADVNIDTLDLARLYRVGGYRQSAVATLLTEKGFKLDLVSKDRLNLLKLMRGRIDLWPTGELLGYHIARQEGVTGIEPVLHIDTRVMGIAFNKSVPDVMIERLNEMLAAMRGDGTVEAIYARYR